MAASAPPSPVMQTNAEGCDTLRLPVVRQRTGLARSTIYRLISENRFPAAVHLTRRAVGWHRADIDAWLETRPKATH